MTRKTFALIACCLLSPAIAAAQTGGLTRVQLLGLQQELKDQCGLAHATGVMDGPTRHAIAVCNKKYGTQGNGAALLAAMDVGFNAGDNPPEGQMSGMGMVMGNGNVTWTDSAGVVHTRRARAAGRMSNVPRDTTMSNMGGGNANGRVSHAGNDELRYAKSGPCAGLRPVDRDAAAHPVDSASASTDVDLVTDDRAVASGRAKAGKGTGDNCTTDKIRKAVPKKTKH